MLFVKIIKNLKLILLKGFKQSPRNVSISTSKRKRKIVARRKLKGQKADFVSKLWPR